MDYVQIQQLVTRYAYALDTGGNNGYDFADLFTPDGQFIDPNAKGREQLAAFGRGPLMGPLNTIHYAMGLVLEPTLTARSGVSTSRSSTSTTTCRRSASAPSGKWSATNAAICAKTADITRTCS